MANNNWNNYTEKTATPVDADEVMVRDSADGKNKKLLFGTFWKWVAKKLNEATISELQTSNKTIVGALNQLNSDKLIRIRSKYTTNENGLIPMHGMLNSMTIDNIVAVKAYSLSGTKNIYTKLYSYGRYAYALITDSNGNSITNTEFNIVVFYMK